MKIEKLTENKIRVIISLDDLQKNNTDIRTLLATSAEAHGLFINILKKAEKEVDFHTEGCRLLIEVFSSSEDVFVFTITKYDSTNTKNTATEKNKPRLIAKRKNFNLSNKQAIYEFDNFDTFCNFCSYVNSIKKININKISKDISLYLYNNTYYLILKNINKEYENINAFYSAISEFAKVSIFSANFSSKLLEHGKNIIKKNAITVGIKYFDS